MAIAEEKMNIPAIIDGDELAEGDVSDKQMDWNTSRDEWQSEITRLKAQMATMMEQDDMERQELQNQWDQSQSERDRLREELRKFKDSLIKEKEELEAKNKRLMQNEKKARRMKEELAEIMNLQKVAFDTSIVDFRKNFIVHIRDMNT
eukprot:TRINITY_DN301_c0_g1_i21.p1 TRINITY_DN301_c0_g1~~TRINITY_DN301_c0_g1_i21.p1  ORF type:complete len:148 (+),score=54.71 TRINITY_DN301_c0_g1_i21:1117-1560(+)